MMRIETLIVTVDQHDFSLIEKMNVQTDAVVGNQSDFVSEQSFCRKNHTVTYYSTTERGVGRNRNLVLEKASADICVFADDDMRFVDGYPAIVTSAVLEAPDADLWIFNLIEKHPKRCVNTKLRQIRRTNYARYGTARIAFRRESIERLNIRFSPLFGGGSCFGSGEDTLFLKECLDKKLKIVAVPYSLAEIDQNAASTWFTGYHKKYFFDKGALYQALYPHAAPLFCIRYLLKYRKRYQRTVTMLEGYRAMSHGRKKYAQITTAGNQTAQF